MKTSFQPVSVAFQDVTAMRGDKTLFSGLSLTLSSAQLIWVQGTNGVGKTTLLRLAAGLSPPAAGTITRHSAGSPCSAQAITIYQGHSNALKRQLSVSEELEFWANIYSFSGAINDILIRVGLAQQAELKCGVLSAGQGRRLAIARLLVSGKPLWIMDEPAAAMDEVGQALIAEVIETHLGNGGAVLAASHDTLKRFKGPTSVLRLEAV